MNVASTFVKSLFGLLILIALSGPIYAQIGALKGLPIKSASLEKKNGTSIVLEYDKASRLALRSTVQIGITATTTKKNGKEKQIKTVGLLGGTSAWASYNIEVTGGTYEDGVISIPRDPRKVENHTIKLTASPKGRDGTQSGNAGSNGPKVTINKQAVEFDMGLLGD